VAQCRLLKIARSTLYYRLAAVSADDLRPCRRRVARGTAAIAGAGHRPTLKPA
jgi:hypothetical protein